MRSGEISLAIEIPAGFARDLHRGSAVSVGAWIDGSHAAAGRDGAWVCAGGCTPTGWRCWHGNPKAPSGGGADR